jgi:hypothetical protein
MAVTKKSTLFFDVILCSLIEVYWYSSKIELNFYQTTWRDIPEDFSFLKQRKCKCPSLVLLPWGVRKYNVAELFTLIVTNYYSCILLNMHCTKYILNKSSECCRGLYFITCSQFSAVICFCEIHYYSKTCLKWNLKGPENFSAEARFPFNRGIL